MGLFAGINGLITSFKQNKLAKKINPIDDPYKENQYIRSLYGAGRNLYQGRMAGAGAAEQNIMNAQANTTSSIKRNATDASEALGYLAGTGGQTQQNLIDLGVAEGADKQNRFGIMSNVSQLMAEEQNKIHEDKLRKYYDDLNYKRGLEGAAMQNKASFFSGLDDTVNTAVSLFSPGGALAGGRSGGGSPSVSNSGVMSNPLPRTSGGAFQQGGVSMNPQFRLPNFNTQSAFPYQRPQQNTRYNQTYYGG